MSLVATDGEHRAVLRQYPRSIGALQSDPCASLIQEGRSKQQKSHFTASSDQKFEVATEGTDTVRLEGQKHWEQRF